MVNLAPLTGPLNAQPSAGKATSVSQQQSMETIDILLDLCGQLPPPAETQIPFGSFSTVQKRSESSESNVGLSLFRKPLWKF